TPAADHYRLMVEHFGDAVMGRAPLRYPPEDAIATLRVVEMIREAMER
ncbi:MAG: gfo/Idh/MocA family oxidoreductase, partial [Chloroflexi bacterium]|nr:gfo/Idh/MocA family oxidoreductase [Chloroflexota bacterium]